LMRVKGRPRGTKLQHGKKKEDLEEGGRKGDNIAEKKKVMKGKDRDGRRKAL